MLDTRAHHRCDRPARGVVWLMYAIWLLACGPARAADDGAQASPAPVVNAEHGAPAAAEAPPTAASTRHIGGSGEQRVLFRVTAPSEAGYDTFLLELTRLGEDALIRLSDDGSNPEDLPFDGVYSGAHTGHYARTITVRLFGKSPEGEADLLYSGVERADDVHEVIVGWRVIRRDQDYLAVRAPAAYPGNITEVHLGLPLLVAFGWGGIVLAYVGFLFQRRREQ